MIARLAARGVVDFAGADLLDPNFWRRLRVLGGALLDEGEVKLRELELHRELACLQMAAVVKSDNLRKFVDRAEEALASAWSLTFPWIKPPDRLDEFRAMEAEWAAEFGDPGDPEVQARIAAACAELRARRLKGRTA